MDFVLAGRSCGCVDLNSAVCPPRLKFDASFTARYRPEVWLCFYTSAYDTISAPDRLRGSRKLAAGKTLASTPGSKSSAKLITRSTMQVSTPHSRPLFRVTYRCQKRAESLPRCAAAPRGESASPPGGGLPARCEPAAARGPPGPGRAAPRVPCGAPAAAPAAEMACGGRDPGGSFPLKKKNTGLARAAAAPPRPEPIPVDEST